MFELHKNKLYVTICILAFVISACGGTTQSQADISTAVAQTVQAQNSLTKIAEAPTWTPAPPTLEMNATVDPLATVITPTSVVGNPGCTLSIRLAGENPPDGTLMKPGEYFWKTWTLENTGTCTWDKTYNLVYQSGDLLGGLTSYALPEIVAPGEIKNITIYLQAPETNGGFTGYWHLQSPWNAYFGAGFTSDPLYVNIVVSDERKPKYGITNVEYALNRNPPEGCPVNVIYTVYATVTVNGPYAFDYYWDQQDGNESGLLNMTFTEAGSQTISRTWMIGRGDSPTPRWMQIIVMSPRNQEYDRFVFQNNCP